MTKIRVSTLREKNWEYLLLLGVKVIIFSSNDLRSQAGGRAPYGWLETRILRQEAERCDNRAHLKSDVKVCQKEWFSLGQNCPRPQGTGRSWGCLWGCSSDWNSWRPFGSLERPDRTVAGPAHHTIYTINYTTGKEGSRATENTHDKWHCLSEISENICKYTYRWYWTSTPETRRAEISLILILINPTAIFTVPETHTLLKHRFIVNSCGIIQWYSWHFNKLSKSSKKWSSNILFITTN